MTKASPFPPKFNKPVPSLPSTEKSQSQSHSPPIPFSKKENIFKIQISDESWERKRTNERWCRGGGGEGGGGGGGEPSGGVIGVNGGEDVEGGEDDANNDGGVDGQEERLGICSVVEWNPTHFLIHPPPHSQLQIGFQKSFMVLCWGSLNDNFVESAESTLHHHQLQRPPAICAFTYTAVWI